MAIKNYWYPNKKNRFGSMPNAFLQLFHKMLPCVEIREFTLFCSKSLQCDSTLTVSRGGHTVSKAVSAITEIICMTHHRTNIVHYSMYV